VVELDGESHIGEAKFEYDQRRQKWLESRGYTVLRFSADYPEQDYLEGVWEAIDLELSKHVAAAHPSRAGKRLDLMRASPQSGEEI
jgi:very-short-patch-repair endonuclease